MLIPRYFVLSTLLITSLLKTRCGKIIIYLILLSPMAYSHIFTFAGIQTKFIKGFVQG